MNHESAYNNAVLFPDRKQIRGRLTIYLGAAAGTGNTYSMLEAAREKISEGFDVMVGLVNTYEYKDMDAFLIGMEFFPSRQLEYKGNIFPELDLDGILKRHPQIVLIDDLAHINTQGSRHQRRYLDIEELLGSGIDVYTTLNIHSVESLNDTVAQITGIRFNNTVPDRFLDTADQVILVDVPTEELIQRFQDGRIYDLEPVGQNWRDFFRPGNINALRELALHYTARNVGKQLEEYRRLRGINQPWPVQERVMACISTSPFSVYVLRQARQIADDWNAEMIAVYVDSPLSYRSGQALADLRRNLQLAEDLGARVVTMNSQDVSSGILGLARQYNISQIILGKPLRPRWREILRRSVVDDIVRGSTGIGVFIVPGYPITNDSAVKEDAINRTRSNINWSLILSLFLVALVTLIGNLYGNYLGLTNIGMLYLLPVVFTSAFLGLVPSIITALVSVLSFDIFFVPPILHLAIYDARHLITFAVFMIVAFTTGNIADQLRLRIKEAIHRENRTKALYDLARELSAVTDPDILSRIVVSHISLSLDAEVVLYLADDAGKLNIMAASNDFSDLVLEPQEPDIADWSYRNAHRCGVGTDTLPEAKGFYLPVKSDDKILGVLGIKPLKPFFSPEQLNILEALAGLTALAIARLKLAAEAQNIKTLEESERLRAALFNSISHDMKTPLASILGAVSSLVDDEDLYNADQKTTLLISIRQGALRMNRVVSNLLDMARLESGYIRLHSDWSDIQDIIGVTLRENRDILQDHNIKVEIPETIRLVKVDYALIEQVLTNLLHNAVKYSPAQSDILVRVVEEQNDLVVSVIDQGGGIAPADEERIFEKFYRLQTPANVSGTGLGLSICKGIIEAHQGRIWAKNRPEGGTILNFTLPIDDAAPRSGENNLEGGYINNGC